MSSIRIVASDDVAKSAGIIPPLLLPNLKNLYSRRADRMHQLANNHPLADYLNFTALIAKAQETVLRNYPVSQQFDNEKILATEYAPLSIKHFARSQQWQVLLSHLLSELMPNVPEQVKTVLDNLAKLSTSELEQLADHLLAGNFSKVTSDKALFLWAALSLYWAQLAAQLTGKAKAIPGEHRHFCPVCESSPVGSIIHIGSENGLRYLHCGLCESEWHMVRIKCSNCEQNNQLDYWSLDDKQASIKAESCSDCGSYLKVFYPEKDPYIEVIADDLASIALDAKMEEQNFARSAVNPFLFPGE